MQLFWNGVGDRRFEAGIDRGVLYIDGAGMVWNGLIAVTEAPRGGDVKSYYVDGIRYLDVISYEEYEATIEAYTYPDQFGDCDGTSVLNHGLYATQQQKKSFGLSYRSRIGNDVDGAEHGYKIHLVYNALVSPTDKAFKTISDAMDPDNFSWHITAKPLLVAGLRPTPHFVINSLETPTDLLSDVEDILYGTVDLDARMPSIGELMSLFENYQAKGFDGGHLTETFYATFDAGRVGTPYTSTIDGGSL